MNFAKDVIEKSQELPVVVDFWAPWCGPCRTLGPAIESLAAEAEGRWELVKVNVDEKQEVAQRYQVMSIPAVKMFHKGEVVGEFVGALPKGQIQKWLDTHIPDPRRLQLQALLDALQGPEPDRALRQLTAFAAENADMPEARLRLAQAHALEAPEVALPMLESLSPGPEELEIAEDIRTLATFSQHPFDQGEAVEQPLKVAREALLARDWDKGLEKLIRGVMIDKSYDNELPRKTTLAIFRLLGASHPMTRKHRRMFDMALY